MKFNSILIITYGRTGSTLLMGLLNAIPGVLIRGENMNICVGLYQAWQSLLAVDKHLSKTGQLDNSRHSTHPFFGGAELDKRKFIRDARNLIEKQLVPHSKKDVHCWGFKEVRYLPHSLGGAAHLSSYLEFLNILMPAPAFLILTRDHAAVLDSGFWKNRTDKEAIRKQMSDFETETLAWMKHRQNAFLIDYQDVIANNERLKMLYDFIGVSYCAQTVRRILEKPHSYDVKKNRLHQARPLQIEYGKPARVANVWMDREVLSAANPRDKLALHGVVVVQASNDEQYSLISVDADGQHAVKWGIESPKFAQIYPDNPRAQRARFAVEGLRISPERPVELYLMDAKGGRDLLCRLTLPVSSHAKV
ncbi:MAG: sulfotransferase [Methylothermaceae bacterium]|nr:sulfotransferase [Methylothermaceae bacterium]